MNKFCELFKLRQNFRKVRRWNGNVSTGQLYFASRYRQNCLTMRSKKSSVKISLRIQDRWSVISAGDCNAVKPIVDQFDYFFFDCASRKSSKVV